MLRFFAAFMKMLGLWITCFYFVFLTPPAPYNKYEMMYAEGCVFMAFVQAGLSTAVCYFFFTQNDQILIYVAVVSGIWTLIGGLLFPALEDAMDEFDEIYKGLERRWAVEDRQREAANRQVFEQTAKAHEAEFRKRYKQDYKWGQKELKKARKLIGKGKAHKIKYYNLRSLYEIQRLEDRGH